MAKGGHDITLTATGSSGQTASATQHITVVAAAIAPLASAPADGTVIDLGSCPSATTVTAASGLAHVASADADAAWVTLAPNGGSVSVAANCATLGSDASFTAQVLVTGDDGAMRL